MGRAIATAHSRAGALTIGFYPGVVSGPLYEGIADFVAERPEIELRLVEGLPRDLHRMLNERTIDLMIVALLPDLASGTLVQERLWDERLTVVLRADHPFASRTSLGWDDVAGLPLILRTSGADQSGHHALLARMGDRPIDCELHDVSRGALLNMVRMGMGATVSLISAVVPQTGIVSVPVEDDRAFLTIEAVWPKADRNPIRHSFLGYIRDPDRKETNNKRIG